MQLVEPPRDREVDQARLAAHDDVAGLDVEVHDALVREVVQDRAEVQRQRQQLLEVHAVAAQQRRQPRPFDVLEHEVRALAAELRAVGAQQHRVRERAQHLRLAPHGIEVVDVVGAQDLDDDQCAQVVGPGEVGLVAPAAAEEADRAEPGSDLVAFGEVPSGHGDNGPRVR